MISFISSILGVICSNYEIHSCLFLSLYGKVCFNIWKGNPWMITTSSAKSMMLKLKNGVFIDHHITFLSPWVELLPLAV